jgi:hypothetical protein
MSLDKYLSVDELVTQMGGDTRTSRWDVMVSYRLAELNQLLEKIWDNKDNSDRAIESFDVSHYEKHKGKDILRSIQTWNVCLKPPMLQFTIDGNCSIQMPVTGNVTTQYYETEGPHKGDKDGEPDVEPISDGWVMTINTPISTVSASEDGQIQDTKVRVAYSCPVL